MTIDEAIKNLITIEERLLKENWLKSRDSIKLGIEALKRRKYESERTSRWADMPLLGETKD